MAGVEDEEFAVRVLMAVAMFGVFVLVGRAAVRMGMGMRMAVAGSCAQITPGAPKHPHRKAEDEHGGNDLKIRLDGFRVPLAAEIKRARGEQPDEERMRNRRGQAEQHRLRDRTANGDDEGGHHGF